ncbi:Uncharacterised protein [Mycobacteroides abscessus subsp. abscessus]|nr:Uncharacterised protein [Mycobacteroides abscessus subsp. abscessus]SHY71448.1 Uncharacterised protein [Mycobacteroides abscessus subsp. abscessus]
MNAIRVFLPIKSSEISDPSDRWLSNGMMCTALARVRKCRLSCSRSMEDAPGRDELMATTDCRTKCE